MPEVQTDDNKNSRGVGMMALLGLAIYAAGIFAAFHFRQTSNFPVGAVIVLTGFAIMAIAGYNKSKQGGV
jgi:uncharacterized membrane protein YgdD (TMEM256/DUF423 family)